MQFLEPYHWSVLTRLQSPALLITSEYPVGQYTPAKIAVKSLADGLLA
jgi:hypothetical protein